MKKKLGELGLFEKVEMDQYTMIMRVPGGWSYEVYYESSVSVCFIPFSKEFANEDVEML